MISWLFWLLLGMLIGVVVGILRMTAYFKKNGVELLFKDGRPRFNITIVDKHSTAYLQGYNDGHSEGFDEGYGGGFDEATMCANESSDWEGLNGLQK